MQHLFFVRHGQTGNNLVGNMNAGDDDDKLTSHGEQQAKQAGQEFKKLGINIDVIVSSSLSRAYETARIIATEIGYSGEINTDIRLREQDGGVFKGRNRDEMKAEFNVPEGEKFRRIFKDRKYNKIEGVVEFDERVSQALNEIQKKYPNKNILIAGHSGTSRPIMRNIKELSFEQAHYRMKGLKNAEIIQLN